MKQLYRIIAVLLCVVLFTACNGKAVDSEQASNQQGSPDTVAWLRIPGTDIDPNSSDQSFDAFKKTIADKNEFIFGSDITKQDKLLTLSACAYRYDTEKTGNQRLVVMAKLLPEGAAEQTVTITANSNPQRP